MFNSRVHQISRNLLKTFILILISCMVVMISGCNQNRSKNFIKLDVPLKDVLSKVILVVPDHENEKGDPLEITVGSKFSGKGEYTLEENQIQEFQYKLHKKHVLEGNMHIYAVVSYNWGGTGTFYYLTAVDKTTLKGDQVFLLGDRVEIKNLVMTKRRIGYVSINYMGRESGTSMSEKPDKTIKQHFTFHQGKLVDVKFLDEK